MLNGGVLDQSTISVTSDDTEAPKLANIKPNSSTTATTAADHHGDEIEQEGEHKNIYERFERKSWRNLTRFLSR